MKLRNIAACAAAVVMAEALSSCVKTWDYTEACKKGKTMLEYLVPNTGDNIANRAEIIVAISDEVILPDNAQEKVNAAIKKQHQDVRQHSDDKDYIEASYSIDEWKEYAKKEFTETLSMINQQKGLGIRFLDRSQMNAAMKEHHFQLSDWSDERKTAQIGKALNADYVLQVKAYPELRTGTHFIVSNNYWGSSCTLSFLNINTFERIDVDDCSIFEPVAENDWSYEKKAAKRDVLLNKLAEGTGKKARLLPHAAGFVSVQKSATKYEGEYLNYVSPFAKKCGKASDKAMKNLDSISFSDDGKRCTVRMQDGSKENGRMKFKGQDPLDLKVLVDIDKVSLPSNAIKKEEAYSVVRWDDIFYEFYEKGTGGEVWEVHLTDKKIGEISINTPSLELEGAVFRDGDQLVIDYKADKEDGSGHHYFAFFTVEDEDTDDGWD